MTARLLRLFILLFFQLGQTFSLFECKAILYVVVELDCEGPDFLIYILICLSLFLDKKRRGKKFFLPAGIVGQVRL